MDSQPTFAGQTTEDAGQKLNRLGREPGPHRSRNDLREGLRLVQGHSGYNLSDETAVRYGHSFTMAFGVEGGR